MGQVGFGEGKGVVCVNLLRTCNGGVDCDGSKREWLSGCPVMEKMVWLTFVGRLICKSFLMAWLRRNEMLCGPYTYKRSGSSKCMVNWLYVRGGRIALSNLYMCLFCLWLRIVCIWKRGHVVEWGNISM